MERSQIIDGSLPTCGALIHSKNSHQDQLENHPIYHSNCLNLNSRLWLAVWWADKYTTCASSLMYHTCHVWLDMSFRWPLYWVEMKYQRKSTQIKSSEIVLIYIILRRLTFRALCITPCNTYPVNVSVQGSEGQDNSQIRHCFYEEVNHHRNGPGRGLSWESHVPLLCSLSTVCLLTTP